MTGNEVVDAVREWLEQNFKAAVARSGERLPQDVEQSIRQLEAGLKKLEGGERPVFTEQSLYIP